MEYIRIPNVYEKLKCAEKTYSPVVMMASSGWGKTAAVNYYYRRRNPLVLSANSADGELELKPIVESIRRSVVVIENAQWITAEDSRDYIRMLFRQNGLQVLILTRGAFPAFLSAEEMDYGFIRITEADFAFGEDEVRAAFEQRGIFAGADDVAQVTKYSRGYPWAVFYYMNHMEAGEPFSEDMVANVWDDIFHMWDAAMPGLWNEGFLDFALAVCRYESFTEEMAAYLTGKRNIIDYLEFSRKSMNQLRYRRDGSYSFREEVRNYYKWKQKQVWSREEILENYRKGAHFYENKGDNTNALYYYDRAGAVLAVKRLLILCAKEAPGNGHFVEMKDYYFAIPGEELRKSPVLMSGMSMLYSIILEPDKSEDWYEALVSFERNHSNPQNLRRQAKARIAYLDIALPHRGTKGIMSILKNAFLMMVTQDIALPEMSVTGNLPSLMNGGLDFCEWSKNDVQIARIMAKPVETVVGRYANGLVTLALAESGFEKGSMSQYEILMRCNDGYQDAAAGGKTEMCFVSAGIQAREYILDGQMTSAKRITESFRKKAESEGADHLKPNIEAFQIWISLYTGSNDEIRKYIDSVPSVQQSFCIMDRYRQKVKLRALIAENRLTEALELSIFLDGFFRGYHRTYDMMENEILMAVILFRQGDEHWKERIFGALFKAAEYDFTRVAALEGAVILPLLKQAAEEDEWNELSEEYTERLLSETGRMAQFYPDYLKYIPREEISLTRRESEVLALLCSGLTTKEICEECGITYSGLKKHNRNIYRKLGASNRAEAQRLALQYGLVHQGNV